MFQRGSDVFNVYLSKVKRSRERNEERRTGRTRHTNWTRKTDWTPSWNFGTGRLVSFQRMQRSIRFRSVPFSSTETTILMGIELLLRASLFFAPINILSLYLRFSPRFDHVFFDLVFFPCFFFFRIKCFFLFFFCYNKISF